MGKRRVPEPSPPPRIDALAGTRPDVELDLHGRTVRDALSAVDRLLLTWERQPSVHVLRIVTGRGVGSRGGAKLLGAVGDRLREELGGRVSEMALDRGGGAWLVRLRR